MLNVWIHTFATDTKVHIALLLVALDFVFGVLAALKGGTFNFSYVADFLRNDILGKLVPYFAFYVMALVAGQSDIVIPGFDFGVLAGAAYATLVTAVGASLLHSITQLRVLPNNFGFTIGPENVPPPAVPVPAKSVRHH